MHGESFTINTGKAKTINTLSAQATTYRAPKGGAIELGSGMIVTGKVVADKMFGEGKSFMELSESNVGRVGSSENWEEVVNHSFTGGADAKQWMLHTIIDAVGDNGVLTGSPSDLLTMQLSDKPSIPLVTKKCFGNAFIGGPCLTGANSILSLNINSLPAHSRLELSARFHFIDSWSGEAAVAEIDGATVWMDTYQNNGDGGINLCGNESVSEGRVSQLIRVEVPHTSGDARVSFRSLLPSHLSSCETSWGVDDVIVRVL